MCIYIDFASTLPNTSFIIIILGFGYIKGAECKLTNPKMRLSWFYLKRTRAEAIQKDLALIAISS